MKKLAVNNTSWQEVSSTTNFKEASKLNRNTLGCFTLMFIFDDG